MRCKVTLKLDIFTGRNDKILSARRGNLFHLVANRVLWLGRIQKSLFSKYRVIEKAAEWDWDIRPEIFFKSAITIFELRELFFKFFLQFKMPLPPFFIKRSKGNLVEYLFLKGINKSNLEDIETSRLFWQNELKNFSLWTLCFTSFLSYIFDLFLVKIICYRINRGKNGYLRFIGECRWCTP